MSDLIPTFAPYSGWLVLSILFILGLTASTYGLLKDRCKPYPRCPKCRYNLTGLDNLANTSCPECGTSINQQTNLYLTKRSYKLIVLGLIIAFSLPIFVIQRRVRQYGWVYYTYVGPLYYVLPDVKVQSEFINGISITQTVDRRDFYIGYGPTTLSIYDQNQLIAKKEGHRWFFSTTDIDKKDYVINKDITGNGNPNTVFYEWSGGAHCCTTLTILENRKDQYVTVFEQDLGNSSFQFIDINNDGIDEIQVHDDIFAYWLTSYAGSPAPPVIFQFDGTAYTPSPELMKQSPPDEVMRDQTRSYLIKLANNPNDFIKFKSEFLHTFTELIYTGNATEALSLFNAAWPENSPHLTPKDQFISDFKAQIQKSPYYPAIRELNGDIFED